MPEAATPLQNLPRLGFGASPLGGIYGEISQATVDDAVRRAIDHGITFFDVAPYYGDTRAETVLGDALSHISRDAYVLATKIGRYGDTIWDFSRDKTLASFEASLRRLKVDRIDLLQCHDIEHGNRKDLIEQALPCLRELKAEGRIGAIGITGYDLATLEKVALSEQVDSVMAFCSFTLQDQRLARTAHRLNAAGIKVFNASPLAMGLMRADGPPQWSPASDAVKMATQAAVDICRGHGTDLATVALYFAVQNAQWNDISTTVVGFRTPAEVEANIRAVADAPDPELLAAVKAAFQPVLNRPWPALAPKQLAPQ